MSTAQTSVHATAGTRETDRLLRARRQNWVTQLSRHALMQPGAAALRFTGRTITWGELHRPISVSTWRHDPHPKATNSAIRSSTRSTVSWSPELPPTWVPPARSTP